MHARAQALPTAAPLLADVIFKGMHPKLAVFVARTLKEMGNCADSVEIDDMSVRAYRRLEMDRYKANLKQRRFRA